MRRVILAVGNLEFVIEHFETLESTMNTAKELAEKGAKEGTVIIADRQTHGRGRDDRSWESPEGGLYLSLILKPDIPANEAHQLIFLSGVAVAKTLSEITEEKMEIKWPNDIVHSYGKIAGVLCETSTVGEELRYAVLGMGINTNIPHFSYELEESAISLLQITKNEYKNRRIAQRILEEISERYEDFPSNFPQLVGEWRVLSNILGKEVLLDGEKVKAIDVDEQGFLIVEDREGSQRKILSGTIEYGQSHVERIKTE
ncbi:MAG: biotin--[acetyl-CoA-carboxylase] ligase [Methanobacteriota archaeon]|nr:MAG: biotin--[acetyl-CoA-carboxylase] ligase [Euryarchaeota archaeon]